MNAIAPLPYRPPKPGIEVLRDWLLAQGQHPRAADLLIGRWDGFPARVEDLLVLDAPAGLLSEALLAFDGEPWSGRRIEDLLTELGGALDAIEAEHGDSLDWLYARSGIPDGPWIDILGDWEVQMDHPWTSESETDTVMRHRGTGVLCLLNFNTAVGGWVGERLSPADIAAGKIDRYAVQISIFYAIRYGMCSGAYVRDGVPSSQVYRVSPSDLTRFLVREVNLLPSCDSDTYLKVIGACLVEAVGSRGGDL